MTDHFIFKKSNVKMYTLSSSPVKASSLPTFLQFFKDKYNFSDFFSSLIFLLLSLLSLNTFLLEPKGQKVHFKVKYISCNQAQDLIFLVRKLKSHYSSDLSLWIKMLRSHLIMSCASFGHIQETNKQKIQLFNHYIFFLVEQWNHHIISLFLLFIFLCSIITDRMTRLKIMPFVQYF